MLWTHHTNENKNTRNQHKGSYPNITLLRCVTQSKYRSTWNTSSHDAHNQKSYAYQQQTRCWKIKHRERDACLANVKFCLSCPMRMRGSLRERKGQWPSPSPACLTLCKRRPSNTNAKTSGLELHDRELLNAKNKFLKPNFLHHEHKDFSAFMKKETKTAKIGILDSTLGWSETHSSHLGPRLAATTSP